MSFNSTECFYNRPVTEINTPPNSLRIDRVFETGYHSTPIPSGQAMPAKARQCTNEEVLSQLFPAGKQRGLALCSCALCEYFVQSDQKQTK